MSNPMTPKPCTMPEDIWMPDDVCMCDECQEFGWHGSKDAKAARDYAAQLDKEAWIRADLVERKGE